MKTLRIRWQRLVTDGQTCPRCGSTGDELEKALWILKDALAPLEIQVELQKEELSLTEFQKAPLTSNQIWVNDRLLEDWLGAQSEKSRCCDTCGPTDCRTVIIDGVEFETIPAEAFIRAGLMAASQMVGTETEETHRTKDKNSLGHIR